MSSEQTSARIESLEPRTLLSAYNFTSIPLHASVGTPRGATRDGSGNIYAITTTGGDDGGNGTILKLAAGSGTIAPLVSFNGTNGSQPVFDLISDTAGNVFGVTSAGGSHNVGTVFKIAAGSNVITVLADLDNTITGGTPNGGLILDSIGDLFGTTTTGGTSGHGTIFEISASTGAYTILASFSATGTAMGRLTLDSFGNLFGNTSNGGGSNFGSVFKLPAGSSAVSTIASFTSTSFRTPMGGMVLDSAGNLFGATNIASASALGRIFKIASGTTTITTVAAFVGTNGQQANGGLAIDASNNLYGFTGGGSGSGYSTNGSIFEVAAGSTSITTLHDFTGADGRGPNGIPVLAGGAVYGAFSVGEPTLTPGSLGGFFKLTLGANTFTKLAEMFYTSGQNSYGGVARDNSGNLFATALNGGTSNLGTVFEVPAGTNSIVTLGSFNGANGANPYSRPTFDSAGNLYGTTYNGGTHGIGAIWKIAAGTTTLQIFASFVGGVGGSHPYSALTLDGSGNLFGTTTKDGALGHGTVFKIAAGTNTITTIDSFNTLNYAYAGVTIGADGTLYGATLNSIWKIPAGSSTISDINSTTGTAYSSVAVDPAGDIYATQDTGGLGGVPGNGSLVGIQAGSNTLLTLLQFDGTNGKNPRGDLFRDAAGNLFGTTFGGGGASGNGGTAFQILAGSNTLKKLWAFSTADGSLLYSNVTVDPQGNLFGDATQGGANGVGAIWSLTISNHLAFSQQPTTIIAGGVIAPAVKVSILDTNGNPVTADNATITLSIQSGPAGATLGGTVSVAAVNGVATFSDLSLTKAGTYTFLATPDATDAAIPALSSASFTVNPGPRAAIVVAAGDAQRTSIGAAFPLPLSARVTDSYGNAIAGAPVTFTAPSSGATMSPTSATVDTDANGIAALTVTAIGAVGPFTATASVAGVVTSASFQLTNGQPLNLTGPAFYLKLDADGQHLDVWNSTSSVGAYSQQVVASLVGSLAVSGTGGAASLTIDFSTGDPSLPPGRSIVSAGAGATLRFVGGGSNHAFTVAANTATCDTDVLSYSAAVHVILDTGGSADTLSILAGATASIAAVATPGTPPRHFSNLSIASGAALDLTNNALIVTSPITTIASYAQTGRIITSMPSGAVGFTDAGGGQTQVRATIGGDADLDGNVGVADLGLLATSYGLTSNALWTQGDFDHNGKVEVGDLGILATNYGVNIAGGPAATTMAIAAAQPQAAATNTVAAAMTVPPSPFRDLKLDSDEHKRTMFAAIGLA